MAIEEAKRSRSEDPRAHPKVGAIVVKEGVVLGRAHRGELGDGDHAEYTLLEKKLKDASLVDATVYVTLEPCTARNHPKVCCASRLLERKVARVVYGMIDPNPVIRGEGIRRLRAGRVEIATFPEDLAAQVEELNREFIRDFDARTTTSTAGKKLTLRSLRILSWAPWLIGSLLTLSAIAVLYYMRNYVPVSGDGAAQLPPTSPPLALPAASSLGAASPTPITSAVTNLTGDMCVCDEHPDCQICKSGRERVAGACTAPIPSTRMYRLRLAGVSLIDPKAGKKYLPGVAETVCVQQPGSTPICATVSDAMSRPVLGLVRIDTLTNPPGIDVQFRDGTTAKLQLRGVRMDRKDKFFTNRSFCYGAQLYSDDGSQIIRFFLEDP
jgi:pyrimidine deaminase RibD-like protein